MSSAEHDLITWLRAQLDEDERFAQAAARRVGPNWTVHVVDEGWQINGRQDPHGVARVRKAWPDDGTGPFIARHDPARVLADVEATRRILGACEEIINGTGWPGLAYVVVRLLASSFADRTGYRQEWRP